MKIKNISNSFEQTEVKSSKYSKCHYENAEKLNISKLGDILSDSEYQYVIKEKSTPERAKNKLIKKIKELECVDEGYIKSLRGAEAKLCYFPIHYMRLDCYNYIVGSETASRNDAIDFGVKGKKDHYADLFCRDAYENHRFFDLSGKVGDDARLAKYADLDVVGSQDMNKVITYAEFDPSEGKEIYAAEYQVLQTVYYPIWMVVVEYDGEKRYSYISDCGDEVNMTVAYNQAMLEEIARRINSSRKYLRGLFDMKFGLWSWLLISAICFVTGIIMNIDKVIKGVAIKAIGPFTVSWIVCLVAHYIVYAIALRVVGIYSENDLLADAFDVSVKKAEILRKLVILTATALPIIMTTSLVIISRI